MNRTKLICGMLVGLMWMAVSTSSLGSGSYAPRLPRAQKEVVDQQKYNLGKQIYTGKARLGEADATITQGQAARLNSWAEQLPKRAKGKEVLPPLAGKLTGEQLEALGYYLQQRYKIKIAE